MDKKKYKCNRCVLIILCSVCPSLSLLPHFLKPNAFAGVRFKSRWGILSFFFFNLTFDPLTPTAVALHQDLQKSAACKGCCCARTGRWELHRVATCTPPRSDRLKDAFALHLVDAGRHLLHKQALLLPLAHQAGEEGEAVVVGPGGAGRRLR